MSLLRKVVLAGVTAAVVLAWSGAGFAQEEGGGGRRQRRSPAEMQQRMMERMKEQLGVNDEEWAVIEPKLSKLNTLRMDLMMGGMRFGRGGRGGETQEEPQSAVAKARQQLSDLVEDNTEGTPPVDAEKISAALTAYREAREKARQEMAAAQEELRQLLTIQQEAQLVLSGYLE